MDENDDGTLGGIFPKFLNNMIAEICSGCTGLRGGYENSPSVIYWDRTKDGRSPIRDSKYPEFHLDIHRDGSRTAPTSNILDPPLIQKDFRIRIFVCTNFCEFRNFFQPIREY